MTRPVGRLPYPAGSARPPEDTAAGCRELVVSAVRLMEQATNPILRRRFEASAAAWRARAERLAAAEAEFSARLRSSAQ